MNKALGHVRAFHSKNLGILAEVRLPWSRKQPKSLLNCRTVVNGYLVFGRKTFCKSIGRDTIWPYINCLAL